MDTAMPYTYLIGWSSHNTWYYGARWANNCDPGELWVKYFTSSHHVASKRKEWGEPDVVVVRQRFVTGREARDWEFRLLRRIGAIKSSHWLNRGNAGVEFFGPSPEAIAKNIARMTGVPRSPETRAKLSASKLGVPSGKVMSASEKEKLRASKLGVPRSAETKAKLRAANLGKRLNADSIAKAAAKNTGKTRSEETKERMRLAWERRRLATPPLTVEQRHAKAARLHEWHATATPEAISVMKERAKISRIRLP